MARRKKVKFLRVEKVMMKLCIILLLLIPASSIFGKAMLSKSNLEVERLKKQIVQHTKRNQSLTMKVNELRSFDNVQQIAESQGLAYNSANVKVIDID